MLTQRSQRCDCGSCIGCGLTIRKSRRALQARPYASGWASFKPNGSIQPYEQEQPPRLRPADQLSCFDGVPLWSAFLLCHAHAHQRTNQTLWSFRGAHPRTQVHHPLGVAWHCCSKVRDGKQGLCMLPKRSFILGYRQITIESDHSGQYTTHIGIENRYSLGETKCGNRSCGGATDSRQLRQEFSGRRENPAVLSNNQLRAPMQISGTTVITQAAPQTQHLIL